MLPPTGKKKYLKGSQQGEPLENALDPHLKIRKKQHQHQNGLAPITPTKNMGNRNLS
jgi:hypothetical protein